MCTSIPFYQKNYINVLQTFYFASFVIKIVNHCGVHVVVWNIEHRLQKKTYHIALFIVVFYEICIKW